MTMMHIIPGLIRATTSTPLIRRLIFPYILSPTRRTFAQTVVRRSLLQVGELTLKDLREECRKRGLKVSGRKLELQERIQQYESQFQNPKPSQSDDWIGVKDQLNEAQLQVERIESQINTVDNEVAHHEGTKLETEHLEQDSNEVGSMVDELKQVQEQLDQLKFRARIMNQDVETIINKDGGDITYAPLPGELVADTDRSDSDGAGVDTLKHELDAARTHAQRLQEIVESELQAAIEEEETSTNKREPNETHRSSSATSSAHTSPKGENTDGKKYILSILGATFGLGWIFQDSLIQRREPTEPSLAQPTMEDAEEIAEVILHEPSE